MSTREARLETLLRRIADGDGEAMERLFDQEHRSLHRLFYDLGRCPALADDLVQNTFLSLWRYRTNFAARGSAAAYIYRVAINQWRRRLARELRSRDGWRRFADDWSEPVADDASVPAETQEKLARVLEALDALPPEQREVFLLHRYHGLSCPQIAEASGAKLKTVESRLRLALEKLVARLRPDDARTTRDTSRRERRA